MMEPDPNADSSAREQHGFAAPRTLSCGPLDGAVRRVLEHATLRDTFRAMFAGELRTCAAGWPRRVDSATAEHWLRAADTLVELARSPAREALELAISVHAESAGRLSDCLLGAPASSSIASRSGQPSEAECGVLAYAAARLVASHGAPLRDSSAQVTPTRAAPERDGSTRAAPWIVRDVRPASLPAAFTQAGFVLWPLAIESSLGRLDAALWIAPSLAEAWPDRHLLEVVLSEQIAPPELSKLAVGDVWVSDGWPLTNTTEGLTGPVTLRVSGTHARWNARLLSHHVRVQSATVAPTPEPQLEFTIARRAVSFSELAELASGVPLFVGDVANHPVEVRHDGLSLAQAELITWRGALGVRISARAPATRIT